MPRLIKPYGLADVQRVLASLLEDDGRALQPVRRLDRARR